MGRTFRIDCIVLLCTFLPLTDLCFGQTVLPLYEGDIPNSIAGPNREQVRPHAQVDTIVTQVSIPTVTVFPAPRENANGAAIIIFPGGGYHTLLIKREGKDVARAFNRQGITAFVVKYRIPDDRTAKDKSMAPLQDAQQAIRLVRENAKRWRIRPDKIGIMGFSAGGHLAATAGTHFDVSYIGNPESTSLRPDFMILINPVISFNDSIGHTGSRRNLLGDSPTLSRIRFFSNERHVSDSTPPTFLVHTNEDSVVVVDNSLRFYLGLRRHKVPAEIHIYAKGEHGFLTAPPFHEWFGRCMYWLNGNILRD